MAKETYGSDRQDGRTSWVKLVPEVEDNEHNDYQEDSSRAVERGEDKRYSIG